MSAIRGIGQDIVQRAYQDAVGKTAAPAESGFAGRLNALLGEVDAAQDKAGELQTAAIRGEDVAPHDVMIAAEQASLTFTMMLEIRNKLVDAYQELMRMQA